MKLRTIFVSLILAAAAQAEPGPAAGPGSAPAPVPVGGPFEVNGIAAKVNGRVITKNQVAFMLAPYYAQLIVQFPRRGPDFERLFKDGRDKVMSELIDRQIILDEFKVMGATLKPQYIDEEINRQVHDQYNGDKAKFNEQLKINHLSPEGFREITRQKLVVQAMRAQHFSDAPPPLPNEIQKAYDEVKLSMRDISKDVFTFQRIYIPANDPNDPGATPQSQLALAESIFSDLQAGKDFAELAKEKSADAHAAEGGLQKDVPRTDLSPPFAAILFDVEPGKVIGPLQDPTGFSIIKVISKTPGASPPLSNPKVREMIEEGVRRKKTEGAYKKWIESKRKSAMISIEPDHKATR